MFSEARMELWTKYRLLAVHVVMVLTVCSPFASCSKLKSLESQVQMLAGRQHLVSVAIQETTASIFDRLDAAETALNETREFCANIKSGDSKAGLNGRIIVSDNTDDILRVTKAFSEEKKAMERLKRGVPQLEMEVKVLEQTMSNISLKVDSIQKEMYTKSELNKVRTFTEDVEYKVEKISLAVQATNAEFNRINERIGTVEKAVEQIIAKLSNVEKILDTINDKGPKYKSCLDIYQDGHMDDGVYTVVLTDKTPLQVYCDMTTDGGGWTVFQRRKNGSVDFNRNWDDYKQGFGNIGGEFWLGNDNIAALTQTCCNQLRIDTKCWGNVPSKYNKFQVLSESENYRLLFDKESSDLKGIFQYMLTNSTMFSTRDRINEGWFRRIGGWWGSNLLSNVNSISGMHLLRCSPTGTEMKLR